MPYGVATDSGLISVQRAEQIMEAAWNQGFRCFDTAEAYGCAAERLAAWLNRTGRLDEASIVTKVQCAETGDAAASAHTALQRFEGAGDLTLLAHGFTPRSVWLELAETAVDAAAVAGQSVYEPHEVTELLTFPHISRIQAPGNIFDRRAQHARASAAVPLDLRSVFLQGILLLSPEAASRRVPGADALVRAVTVAAGMVGRPAAELLVAAMLLHLTEGDRLVLGADSPEQINGFVTAVGLRDSDPEIVHEFEQQVATSFAGPADKNILDPRLWH
jgi:aryl-alcohol dehydrogenase-like predicted oxidoreductase